MPDVPLPGPPTGLPCPICATPVMSYKPTRDPLELEVDLTAMSGAKPVEYVVLIPCGHKLTGGTMRILPDRIEGQPWAGE